MSSLLSALPARCVGPAMSSRVSGLAVYDKDPKIFYIGMASGGVFKTTDGGHTTTAVFDREGGSSIGAIALSQQDPNLVWVGPGEGWQRNDIGWGDGIYKSTDGGKSWKNMGLPNVLSFGRIVINPKDNDNVFAAVLGSAWGPGPDRGIYRTKDGGKTWKKVLFVNDRTAGADITVDPKNPKNLVAAMWDHIHRPYMYDVGGPESGIYRSTDGGDTWHKVTKGLPKTQMGRIAVDFFRKDPRYIAAAIEADPPTSGFYRSSDGGETWVEMAATPTDPLIKKYKISQWGRPYYDQVVRYDPDDVNTIYEGTATHYTFDGGKTFVGFTGGDQHGVWIDPANRNHYITLDDGGAYQGWDLRRPGGDTTLQEVNLPPVLQMYGIGYDMRKLYWVMGNNQDGHGWSTPTQTIHGGVARTDSVDIHGGEAGGSMADPNDWTTVYSQGRELSLDRNNLATGSVERVDSFALGKPLGAYTDPGTYGQYQKANPPLRAGYYPGFVISPWNSKTLYFGCNYLFKSVDRGDHWQIISPDLTHNRMDWQVPGPLSFGSSERSGQTVYQCIHTISESPLRQGLIWVGTDDGFVQLTRDDGKTWTNITANIPALPPYTWVSQICASKYVEGRAYATFDGHKNLDLKTYVYKTEDYGKTWTKIIGNLPAQESCYVIKEGLKNPDLLFLGTEFSLWVSMDRGKNWDRYQSWNIDGDRYSPDGYLPTVSIYDLQIQPRELDLIIGTHGRSIWTLPIRALEELTAENRKKEVCFTSPGNVYLFPSLQMGGIYNPLGRVSKNTQPGTLFSYYLKHDARGKANITVTNSGGSEVYAILKGPAKAGLNSLRWMTTITHGPIKRPGDYRVILTVNGRDYAQTLHVEDATYEVLPGCHPAKYPSNIILPPTRRH
ncbi:MAG TPA: hypothetical protein VGL56_06375 [Fimbriimonadaceae bacterium]